jgi:mRNA-degrading endonuclease toxin of MazEF toxin-antitoxin module
VNTSELQQGSIIWLRGIPDPQGRNPKAAPRPFVVISSNERIRTGPTIDAIAITSTFREPVTDPTMVPMRWNARGTTETRFRRKCFAKVNWMHVIKINETSAGREFEGETEGAFVRAAEVALIVRAIERLTDL